MLIYVQYAMTVAGLDVPHTHFKAEQSYSCLVTQLDLTDVCGSVPNLRFLYTFITSTEDALTRWVYVVLLNFDPVARTSAAVCSTNFKVQRHGTRSGIQPISGCLPLVQSTGHLVLHKGLWVRIAICFPFCRNVIRYSMILLYCMCQKMLHPFLHSMELWVLISTRFQFQLIVQLHLHLKTQCACFTVYFYLVFYVAAVTFGHTGGVCTTVKRIQTYYSYLCSCVCVLISVYSVAP